MPEVAGLFYSGHIAGEALILPPVVLLHGAGGNRLNWALRRIPGRAVIAVDLPGHGAMLDRPGRSTIADYAASVIGFLDAINVDRAVFAGHSMGGAISLGLALENPERVAGLALISTGARLRVHPAILDNIVHDPKTTVQQIVGWSWSSRVTLETRAQMTKQLLAIPVQTLHDDFAACNAFDVSNRLGPVQVPTLILVGADDQMTPVKYSIFMAERIARSKFTVIPNAGHMLTLEQPTLFASEITTWLTSSNVASRS